MANSVDIRHVTHRYGDRLALHDVSLIVPKGVLFGLLGPNGGGKTTLFRILSTLLQPTAGTAQVLGLDTVAQPDAVRRRLGVIFQQPALDDGLTVRENLRFHGALYSLTGAALSTRVEELAGAFGLEDRLGDRVGKLSGGLRRRADLARGLLHRPDVLLLDEPTTGLDPAARLAFWQTLDRLRRDEATTLLLATHLMDEAERCDALALLDQGRIVAEGTPEALKKDLGATALWLDTADASALADALKTRMNLETQVIGGSVRIAHPDAPSLLPSLYDTFGPQIERATVRKPSLDDVFLVHAGRAFVEALEEAHA